MLSFSVLYLGTPTNEKLVSKKHPKILNKICILFVAKMHKYSVFSLTTVASIVASSVHLFILATVASKSTEYLCVSVTKRGNILLEFFSAFWKQALHINALA